MRRRRDKTSFFALLTLPVISAAKEALARGAERVVAKAKEKCPVKTGNLHDSIHAESFDDGKRVKVVADAADKKSGVYYGKIVEFSPKINRPYLYPAVEEEREKIMEDIRESIRESLAREVKG